MDINLKKKRNLIMNDALHNFPLHEDSYREQLPQSSSSSAAARAALNFA